LTTEYIRNTNAYKEYYACATGEAAPKPKVNVERTEAEHLKIVLRRSRQETYISQQGGSSTDEGTGSKPWVLDVPSDDSEEEILWNSSDDEDSIFTTASSPIAPLPTTTPIMTPSTIATITTSSDAPIPPTTIPSTVLENLPTFDSVFRFEDRVKSLEVNFSKFMQTNQFADVVSKIPGIVHQYITQQMTKATDRLQDSLQRENDEFLRTIDENMKKIIKGQVKSQVKEQVSRILPRIKGSVNAQLEAEVLTRSSNSSRTSYAIAADLTEMELKKILIEKMEGNKFIQ
nr:hypothetical protein [Tanacetum cinerariifolium]